MDLPAEYEVRQVHGVSWVGPASYGGQAVNPAQAVNPGGNAGQEAPSPVRVDGYHVEGPNRPGWWSTWPARPSAG